MAKLRYGSSADGREVAISKIFINYRREDSSAAAGRLHDALGDAFGFDNLFIDVDNMPVGVDFVDHLQAQVSGCDIFLSIIGPDWVDAKDDIGNRRLENPNDYVATEIAAALKRNIPVVPVLVDGARLPSADQLPESLKPLARRHAVEVRTPQFRRDANALIQEIRQAIESKQAPPVRWVLAAANHLHRRRAVVAAGVLAGLISGLATFYLISEPTTGDAQRLVETRTAADVQKAADAKAAEDARRAAEAKAVGDARRAAEAKAVGDARRAAEAKAVEDARRAAEARAAESARRAAEARAAEDARRAAEAKAADDAQRTAAAVLDKFNTRDNRDSLANDILVDGKIGAFQPDIGGCAVQCDNTPACKAFAFDHINERCYLKTGISTPVIDPRSTIATKKPLQIPTDWSATKPEIVPRRNNRIADQPTVRRKVSDFNSCRTACLESLSCVAFNFLKDSRSENCEMFKGMKRLSSDNSVDSGYKLQAR